MIEPSEEAGAAPPSPPLPLEVLRNATSDCHRQLEAAIDWQGAFQSYETYRNLLERFALIAPGLEQAIAQQLAGGPPPEFNPDLRTGWLAADLAALTASQRQAASVADRCRKPAAAYPGRLRIHRRRAFGYRSSVCLRGLHSGWSISFTAAARALAADARARGAYFAAYGAATGQHGKRFGSGPMATRRWAVD